MDAHKNFAYSTVATAPSPATTGLSLVVATGDGAKFPAAPFNATVWAAGASPITTNSEIVRVTAIAADTLTIVRAQETGAGGPAARTIVVGDQIAATITAKTLTDIEALSVSGLTVQTVTKDLSATVTGPATPLRFYYHTENTLQGAAAAPAGSLTISEWPPDQTDATAASIAGGHLSTSTGADSSLLNKPTTKDQTVVAGGPPTTTPPIAAHQFGWFSDKQYTGTFAAAPWYNQWREDDNNVGLIGLPVINVWASTTRDFAGTMRFIGQMTGTQDWWSGGTGVVFTASAPLAAITLANEFLFTSTWCHETSGFTAGQTLTIHQEGSDLADTARSWLTTSPFSKQITMPQSSGTFDITGLSGLTAGRAVYIQQAVSDEDDAELDNIKVTAYCLNSTTIRAFWEASGESGPMSGNVTFQYTVSA